MNIYYLRLHVEHIEPDPQTFHVPGPDFVNVILMVNFNNPTWSCDKILTVSEN